MRKISLKPQFLPFYDINQKPRATNKQCEAKIFVLKSLLFSMERTFEMPYIIGPFGGKKM